MAYLTDTYQRITDTIVAQLEAGTKPWVQPWRSNAGVSPIPRRSNGEAYRGINVIMLWIARKANAYAENTWITYKQAQEFGGQVRKGERSTLVIKYGTFTPADREDADDEREFPTSSLTTSSTSSRSTAS